MFISFGVIVALYVIASLVLPLKASPRLKLALALLVVLGAGRLAVMRRIFGGLGGIEAPRWLLLSTSFVQGALVVLMVFLVVRDLLWLLTFAFGPKRTLRLRRALRGIKATVALAAAAAVLGGLGLYGAAKVPEVRQAEVVLKRWPKGLDGLRVAILADMHISKFFDRRWVESVVSRTNAETPDMIWMPGDMVDGTTEARAPDVAPLADLKAPYGIYASMGNHEYISRALEWLPVFDKLGIRMLYNGHVVTTKDDSSFVLAGVNDVTALGPRYNLPGPDLAKALSGAPEDLPVVLMEHRPLRARLNAADPRLVLQVSGHTHAGMIPILKTLVARANGGFLKGFYQVDDLTLYVLPGLGLWSGFPMRLASPSEITILTIRAAS